MEDNCSPVPTPEQLAVRAEWTAALRGAYAGKQGRGALRAVDWNTETAGSPVAEYRYCCLGVLADQLRGRTDLEPQGCQYEWASDPSDAGSFQFRNSAGILLKNFGGSRLPQAFMAAVGMDDAQREYLVVLNDGRFDSEPQEFPAIADWIDAGMVVPTGPRSVEP